MLFYSYNKEAPLVDFPSLKPNLLYNLFLRWAFFRKKKKKDYVTRIQDKELNSTVSGWLELCTLHVFMVQWDLPALTIPQAESNMPGEWWKLK